MGSDDDYPAYESPLKKSKTKDSFHGEGLVFSHNFLAIPLQYFDFDPLPGLTKIFGLAYPVKLHSDDIFSNECKEALKYAIEKENEKKFNPSRMGMTVTLVKEALGAHNFLQDNDEKVQSAPAQVQQRFLGVPDKDIQFSATGAVKGHKVLKQVDSTGDSDDNVVSVPTSKGGIRRKHHRAWTLSEVMKLVQGVSRYGAGRWSEIKRLAFASYSYRTSVDLKDKWRNLLKASLAQISSNKGINSRKNVTSMPIPEPILLRVGELAEMQSQVPPNLSSSKVAGNSVHEKQSGCL
ncbi:hypothetical protein GH714_019013 [Hevea brasiliensis]|uniref:Uncharacterized protein n=1 Tax=Hevea brasiliensis TaxID=3981 RepID=A0A6A6LLJ6_HEVBR|nr:hypothetical protein GH714_019013 [Hevea brasiliensis]